MTKSLLRRHAPLSIVVLTRNDPATAPIWQPTAMDMAAIRYAVPLERLAQ